MEQRVFSVTEVNQYIKQLIDDVPQLNELLIRGELSNYKIYPSGHHYFTLKDGVDKVLSERLKGAGNTAEGLGKALEGIELADYVMGLKTGIFIGFMTSSGK